MHPELFQLLLQIGDRDLALLNSSHGVMVLRRPYSDLDEAAELTELFQGELGTADQPTHGVLVLPPANKGEPPPRIPLTEMEFEKWFFILSCYDESQHTSQDLSQD